MLRCIRSLQPLLRNIVYGPLVAYNFGLSQMRNKKRRTPDNETKFEDEINFPDLNFEMEEVKYQEIDEKDVKSIPLSLFLSIFAQALEENENAVNLSELKILCVNIEANKGTPLGEEQRLILSHIINCLTIQSFTTINFEGYGVVLEFIAQCRLNLNLSVYALEQKFLDAITPLFYFNFNEVSINTMSIHQLVFRMRQLGHAVPIKVRGWLSIQLVNELDAMLANPAKHLPLPESFLLEYVSSIVADASRFQFDNVIVTSLLKIALHYPNSLSVMLNLYTTVLPLAHEKDFTHHELYEYVVALHEYLIQRKESINIIDYPKEIFDLLQSRALDRVTGLHEHAEKIVMQELHAVDPLNHEQLIYGMELIGRLSACHRVNVETKEVLCNIMEQCFAEGPALQNHLSTIMFKDSLEYIKKVSMQGKEEEEKETTSIKGDGQEQNIDIGLKEMLERSEKFCKEFEEETKGLQKVLDSIKSKQQLEEMILLGKKDNKKLSEQDKALLEELEKMEKENKEKLKDNEEVINHNEERELKQLSEEMREEYEDKERYIDETLLCKYMLSLYKKGFFENEEVKEWFMDIVFTRSNDFMLQGYIAYFEIKRKNHEQVRKLTEHHYDYFIPLSRKSCLMAVVLHELEALQLTTPRESEKLAELKAAFLAFLDTPEKIKYALYLVPNDKYIIYSVYQMYAIDLVKLTSSKLYTSDVPLENYAYFLEFLFKVGEMPYTKMIFNQLQEFWKGDAEEEEEKSEFELNKLHCFMTTIDRYMMKLDKLVVKNTHRLPPWQENVNTLLYSFGGSMGADFLSEIIINMLRSNKKGYLLNFLKRFLFLVKPLMDDRALSCNFANQYYTIMEIVIVLALKKNNKLEEYTLWEDILYVGLRHPTPTNYMFYHRFLKQMLDLYLSFKTSTLRAMIIHKCLFYGMAKNEFRFISETLLLGESPETYQAQSYRKEYKSLEHLPPAQDYFYLNLLKPIYLESYGVEKAVVQIQNLYPYNLERALFNNEADNADINTALIRRLQEVDLSKVDVLALINNYIVKDMVMKEQLAKTILDIALQYFSCNVGALYSQDHRQLLKWCQELNHRHPAYENALLAKASYLYKPYVSEEFGRAIAVMRGEEVEPYADPREEIEAKLKEVRFKKTTREDVLKKYKRLVNLEEETVEENVAQEETPTEETPTEETPTEETPTEETPTEETPTEENKSSG